MHTVFKFNEGIVTNTSKYNLAEGLGFKKPIKFLCHKNNWYKKINVCCQNRNEILKDTWYVAHADSI